MSEAREPGASVAEVARRHDLNANLLFNWLLKAGYGRRGRRVPAETASPDRVEFVPLGHFTVVTPEVAGDPAAAKPVLEATSDVQRRQHPRPSPRKTRRRSGVIEIGLPGGACVRVDASVNLGALRRVFEALKVLA